MNRLYVRLEVGPVDEPMTAGIALIQGLRAVDVAESFKQVLIASNSSKLEINLRLTLKPWGNFHLEF